MGGESGTQGGREEEYVQDFGANTVPISGVQLPHSDYIM
jgi:hypothetical protein